MSVLDLRHAATGTRRGHWSITGVRWSYLTDGALYDARSWTSRMPPAARPLTPADRAAASPVADIFGSAAAGREGFRLTRAALDLAGAARSTTLLGTTRETDPLFVVALTKEAGFTAYGTSHGTGRSTGAATAFTGLTVAIYSSQHQP